MAIDGDADGIGAMSRAVGGHAGDAHSRATTFSAALATLPATAFAGGKAEQSRRFATEMQAATLAAGRAYETVAAALPRVADAVHQSQQADRAHDRAAADLRSAEADASAAAAALTAATAVVAGARATGAVAKALGGHGGPTPAQLAAQEQAQRRLDRARREVDDAQRTERRAARRLEDAEQHRQSVLRSFQHLCRAQSASLGRAVPTPPPAAAGDQSFFAQLLAGPVCRGMVDALRYDAHTLHDAFLSVQQHGYSDQSIARLSKALQGVDPHGVNRLADPLLATSAGWAKLSRPSFQERLYGAEKELAVGAADGTIELGKGGFETLKLLARTNGAFGRKAQLEQLAQNKAMFRALGDHPLEHLKNVFNTKDLFKRPVYWLGKQLPGALAGFATGGSARALTATTGARDALRADLRGLSHRAVAHDADPDLTAQAARTHRAIQAANQRIAELKAKSARDKHIGRGISATQQQQAAQQTEKDHQHNQQHGH